MVTLIQSPLWFYMQSLFIDFIGAILLAIVAFLALRIYFLRREKKWMIFGTAFAILATSFFGQVILQFALNTKRFVVSSGGVLSIGISATHFQSFLFFLAVVGLRFLLLYGLFLLYSTYRPSTTKSHAFVIYLLGVLMYFSGEAYYVFHLTALILTLMIMTEYIIIYRRNHNTITMLLAFCFGVLMLSQFGFILVSLSPAFFVASQVIQVIGFLFLLISLIMVRKHGKKIKT